MRMEDDEEEEERFRSRERDEKSLRDGQRWRQVSRRC